MITNILVIACPVWGVLARFAAAAVGDVASRAEEAWRLAQRDVGPEPGPGDDGSSA